MKERKRRNKYILKKATTHLPEPRREHVAHDDLVDDVEVAAATAVAIAAGVAVAVNGARRAR